MSLRYDAANRLVEEYDNGALCGINFYDAFNRRVARYEVGGGGTRYVYSGWRVVEERDVASGAVVRQFVDGEGFERPRLRWSASPERRRRPTTITPTRRARSAR